MVSESRRTPWELWLSKALPLPYFVIGALAAALILGLQLGFHLLFDYPIWDDAKARPTAPIRSTIVTAIVIGYVLPAFWTTREAIFRELAAYAGESGDAVPLPDFTFGVESLRTSRKAGAAAVTMVLMTTGLLPLVVPDWDFAPGAMGGTVWFSLLAWIVGRFASFTLVAASEAAGPRAPELHVDLLDPAPLACFGRIGLRLSLGWIGGISIFVLLSALFPFYGEGGAAVALLVPVFLATLVVATLALVIPVRGVRTRIREAKRAALKELRGAVREARDAAVKGDLRVQGHLSDLLAYRAYVEGLREWPFDTSTLVRFALYTLIPVGSWLGGALVERIVDAALG